MDKYAQTGIARQTLDINFNVKANLMGNETKPTLKTKTFNVKVASDVVEGERTIIAVVSSSNFDRDNERVDVKSLRLPLKKGGSVVAKDLTSQEEVDIPLLINHSFDVEDVIGSVRKAYLNEAGELIFELGISNRDKAQDLMTLIDEGHLDNAFSITMSDYQYSDSTIFDAEVIEVSLVFRGSNKDARILAVKSLIKGDDVMAEAETPEVVEAEIVEQEQAEVVEETTEVEAEEIANDDEAEDDEIEAEEEAEEAESEAVEELNNKVEKETKKMANEIAVKQVKDAVEGEIVEKSATMSKDAYRELFVKQFIAFKTGDRATLSKLNKQAMEAEGAISKAIAYDDGASIFQTAIVSNDILEEYTNVGRVGSMVTRVDINGAETWKQLTQTAGDGFQPVGVEEVKEEDKPIWSHLSIEPKEHAMIVAWYDAMAKRTPLAVYQIIISYIAKEYAKLEDKIILSFEGATTDGGDEFVATGLEPILRTAGRTVNLSSYDAEDVVAAFGEAFGLIESDATLTAVCNRATWASLATSVDTLGRPIFTMVGQQVAIGALGTFNIVLSQEVTDGSVIFGAFGDYELVTNGGLATLFSQQASVGNLNLFTSDASAIRATVDIAGKPIKNTSFVVIDNTTVS